MSKSSQLSKLKKEIETELVCELKDAAQTMVFGKGSVDADIFFIGEAPGAAEDEQGIPFVGRAGKDLDKLLQTIGLTLDDVYIANILKYRPPKNRDPTKAEMELHTPYLKKQIDIIQPKVIVPLGNFATKFVLAGFQTTGMSKIKGISVLHATRHTVDNFTVFPLYHPAAMLYNPKLRLVLEADICTLANLLSSNQNL